MQQASSIDSINLVIYQVCAPMGQQDNTMLATNIHVHTRMSSKIERKPHKKGHDNFKISLVARTVSTCKKWMLAEACN